MLTKKTNTAPMVWKTVRVAVFESERGWGQNVVERHEFPTKKAADKFVKTFNDRHCPPKKDVPDYYLKAVIVG